MEEKVFSQNAREHKCQSYGAPLSEDSVFCVNCGAKVSSPTHCDPISHRSQTPEAPVSVPTANKEGAALSRQKLISLIVGSVLIVIGLTRVFAAGTTISSSSFGGDFYTYTYRGIVAISEQLASIQASLGWVIVAIGAAIDVSALRK